MLLEEKVWCERYRPKTLEDCLLPPATRILFNSFVEKKFVPNMLLSGQPGIGKTTAAKCVLNDIGAEHITINGSIKGNIDTLRNDIQQFASTVSYNGGKKYVILDEADNLTQATQLALRGFIEEYSANCGYIFTCNFRNKIIDAIADSRLLSEIDFTFRSNERQELAKGLFKKLTVIFTSEGVLFTPDDLKNFIVIFLNKSNDLRKLFITAQKFASSGAFVVDTITTADSRFVDLVAILKSKNFVKMRTWVGENSDIEPSRIYRFLFENGKEFADQKMVPAIVPLVGKYQFQQAFVADSEINVAACLTDIMAECVV